MYIGNLWKNCILRRKVEYFFHWAKKKIWDKFHFMRSCPKLYKRENNMAETPSETTSTTEKVYNELSKMRCEGLFCRRCACYYATKDEFSQHIQEHLNERNDGKENFMSYIENYICSKCGKQFEVKSDLIIHYNTVCIDALYVCKHCRENCENSPFLQMHLVVHHNYSEEMLRDEGYLTDLDDNPFFSGCSFMTSFKRKAFKSPPPAPEVDTEVNNRGSLTLVKATYSRKYRTSRKTANTRQNLAFNLLSKSHTCYMCNESFSRKCVLEIHVQKHISEESRGKKVNRSISKRGLAFKVSENNCSLTRNTMQNSENIGSPEVKELLSNNQRPILKPSNVVLRTSVFKKVKPKRKFRGEKSYVSNGNDIRKNKKTGISKVTRQNASNTNANSQLVNKTAVPVAWKKIKLKSKFRNDVSSDEQKDSEKSNKTKKPQSGEKKPVKESSKNKEKQVFICELCKKHFKDGYKLKRHFLIHTGERPFTCTKCMKTFVRDDHLKRHIKRVCGKTDNSQSKK